MNKGLILAVLMVSVTSFADTLKLDCKSASSDVANSFSGVINLETQVDEVVFADTFLSASKGAKDSSPELLTLENMHGTQQKIAAGNLGKNEVTSITLFSDEDTEVRAYLVVNLGMQGINSRLRLTLNSQAIHYSRCSVVK